MKKPEGLMDAYLTTGEAAKILDLSPDSVRRFEREGLLKVTKLGTGQRLFFASDVHRLRETREKSSELSGAAN